MSHARSRSPRTIAERMYAAFGAGDVEAVIGLLAVLGRDVGDIG